MDKTQLEQFRKAYDVSMRKGIKGKDKDGHDIEEQSEWVWFDRATIEQLLELTDPKTGGIKMYFCQYDKENIDLLPPEKKNRDEYIGRMSLALAASNKTSRGYEDLESSKSGDNSSARNAGNLCPPDCNQ